ncbi:hypothetical protein [Roseobacter sp. SK209-2-6]|uniref:hypothetical protein n=1 Tax=Roseobacter sp. SK209-2-6 TaxID=388739 RepID=UPI0012F516D4|nr:hypothetical protein [Roseobacter sp. SK209-2-6]
MNETTQRHFANFICRFGDDKVLLDYAKSIVVPAFTKDTYVRSYGKKTHYHFYEVELMDLAEENDDPIMVLAGRFVKQTELTRTQVFDDSKGLVHDEASLLSAPSAFFVLMLNNHRLIYFPETPHAPDINAFRVTAQQFLRQRHKEAIDLKYEKTRAEDEPPTKKSLYEAHPRPSLEVVPLTGKADIATFMRRFEKLKKINFRVVKPNDDINAGEILGQVRELSDALGSTSTKVTASSGDGLDIPAAIEAVTEATGSGNQDVSVSGLDTNGNSLSGNNEQFRLSAEIENVPLKKGSLVRRLVDTFSQLRSAGSINAPSADANAVKVKKLRNLL